MEFQKAQVVHVNKNKTLAINISFLIVAFMVYAEVLINPGFDSNLSFYFFNKTLLIYLGLFSLLSLVILMLQKSLDSKITFLTTQINIVVLLLFLSINIYLNPQNFVESSLISVALFYLILDYYTFNHFSFKLITALYILLQLILTFLIRDYSKINVEFAALTCFILTIAYRGNIDHFRLRASEDSKIKALTRQIEKQNATIRTLEEKNRLKVIELELAIEKSEESDRLKAAFLANLSHEIRTPMNGILGFSSLLNDPYLSADEKEEYLTLIQRSGARMINILSEIVDISRIDSKSVEVNYKTLNLKNFLNDVYTAYKPIALNKNLAFSIEYKLPDKCSEIITDINKLNSILSNLVNNAIKYTDNGFVVVGCSLVPKRNDFEQSSIHSENELEKENILFFVEDTGIGIPVERQEAIFERFIQAEIYDTQARQGAGLGLSIAKAYIELLGGKIWVESQVGQGTVFYFTLPVNQAICPS